MLYSVGILQKDIKVLKPITLKKLERAHYQVIRELKSVGLYTQEVSKTQCVLTYAPAILTLGYFIQSSSNLMNWCGLQEGHIYLPNRVIGGHLVQILRHEYGHALLWHHPEIKRKRIFSQVFNEKRHSEFLNKGWVLWNDKARCWDEPFISEYAKTDWEEDFCETFANWLQHKGNYQNKKYGAFIDEKMSIISKLPELVKSTQNARRVS